MANEAVPPSVRIIRAAAAAGRGRRRGLASLLVLAVLACWLAGGLYAVANGASAVVRRFGHLVERRVEPGLHLALPPGVDAVTHVKTGEVMRLQVAGDNGAPMSLITGDENLIETTLVVQYRISSPDAYLFAAEDPTALLTQAVRAAMVDEIARRTVEEVLTSGKASVQNEVRRKAQAMLQAFGAGLSLVAVTLQAVNPPPEAVAAFLEVSDARAQAARAVNEAQTRRDSSLNLARGRAERVLAEARSWADQRQQTARGAASRFDQVLDQARRTPRQARTDFYLAMVRKVLPKARIVVLAPGEKPRIDIYLNQPTGGGGTGAGAGSGGAAAGGPGGFGQGGAGAPRAGVEPMFGLRPPGAPPSEPNQPPPGPTQDPRP
ncbi:MAG TPA: FtsH protease activity modulator HflK [Thermoanaerobaculia bacterium]|nr:FtsH protease activity modulator HflK [Thermoanaerobaculia bacterium]